MLWLNTLDLAGMHEAKSEAITLVTNRHFTLENFQMHLLRAGFDDAQSEGLVRSAIERAGLKGAVVAPLQ